MKIGRLLVAVLFMSVILGVAGWADELKLATIDLNKIVDAHPYTKPARDLLEKQKDDLKDEEKAIVSKLEGMQKEVEELRKEAMNKGLNDKEKAEKEALVEAKIKEFRAYDKEAGEKYALRKKDLSEQYLAMKERVISKIRDLVGDFAEKKGYTVVFDANSVVYSSKLIDITDDVLKVISDMEPDQVSGKKD